MVERQKNTFSKLLAEARKELDSILGEVEYRGAMRIIEHIEYYAAIEREDANEEGRSTQRASIITR